MRVLLEIRVMKLKTLWIISLKQSFSLLLTTIRNFHFLSPFLVHLATPKSIFAAESLSPPVFTHLSYIIMYILLFHTHVLCICDMSLEKFRHSNEVQWYLILTANTSYKVVIRICNHKHKPIITGEEMLSKWFFSCSQISDTLLPDRKWSNRQETYTSRAF